MLTFGQRPLLTDPAQLDEWQPDVAVIGAPFDLGTTNRPGARFGPRAIRTNAYQSGTYHLGLGLEMYDWIDVVDYGDAACPNGLVDESLANIKARVHEVASRRIVPFVIGGDHTITWPSATAVAEVYGYGHVGMIHFDAHADTADSIDGNLPASYQQQLDQGYNFGSVRTFGQRPLLTSPEELDEWQPDVAVVGAPFDLGTTNRPGARFGPRALRADAYQSGTYHLGLGLEMYDWMEVVDYGDAACPNGLVDESLANIRNRVHEVASRRIVPFVIGGDHTITWPAATAVADVYGYGNVGMVHFDAHADTADTVDGNLASHGTPMRRLIESGAIPGKNFIQIGLRSYWPPEAIWNWMAEQGMRWHLMDEIWERGFQAVMADAVAGGPRRPRAPVHLDRHRRARPGLRAGHRHP